MIDTITLKSLMNDVPDRIMGVHTIDNKTTVVEIPNGRVILLPKDKKIKMGYSLRNGGRKTPYVCSVPEWRMHESWEERRIRLQNNMAPKRRYKSRMHKKNKKVSWMNAESIRLLNDHSK